MSSFTIAQEREIRTIVAEMIGQALRGADERLFDQLHAAEDAARAAGERSLERLIR